MLALPLRRSFCARAEKVARGQEGKIQRMFAAFTVFIVVAREGREPRHGVCFAAVVALILELGQVAPARLTFRRENGWKMPRKFRRAIMGAGVEC